MEDQLNLADGENVVLSTMLKSEQLKYFVQSCVTVYVHLYQIGNFAKPLKKTKRVR